MNRDRIQPGQKWRRTVGDRQIVLVYDFDRWTGEVFALHQSDPTYRFWMPESEFLEEYALVEEEAA